jgi:hypothetical protein
VQTTGRLQSTYLGDGGRPSAGGCIHPAAGRARHLLAMARTEGAPTPARNTTYGRSLGIC